MMHGMIDMPSSSVGTVSPLVAAVKLLLVNSDTKKWYFRVEMSWFAESAGGGVIDRERVCCLLRFPDRLAFGVVNSPKTSISLSSDEESSTESILRRIQ